MKRASHIVAAAWTIVLTLLATDAFGLRFSSHGGCGELCSKEFWAGATGDDVAAELARAPRGRSYLGHMIRLAVSSGANADAVKALLRAGAPPNARLSGYPWDDDYGNRTLLQEAARRDAEVVSALLDGGAFPHLADPRGRTPLHEAVEAGLAGAVSRLLEAGADPLASDGRGVTPVDLAAGSGDARLDALVHAVREPARCGRLCAPEFWRTATAGRVAEALAQAMHAGERSRQGDAPLHAALAAGAEAEAVKLLLDHGADPNARNAHDDTPLHVAARTPGSAAAMTVLLERGATLEAVNGRDWTPLHVASERAATIDAMRVLLDAGADPSINAGDVFGVTAWSLAAKQPAGPQATALLFEHITASEHLAAIGVQTSLGFRLPLGLQPPLHFAAAEGHPETVALFLERGVHPGLATIHGETPVHNAARAGNVAALRVLLAHGADPNWSKYDRMAVLSGEGQRPLHDAVHHAAAVELLLAYGADPNGRVPGSGETPLHRAARYCQGASLRLLLAAGADPNARDEYARTPLYGAISRARDSEDTSGLLQRWRASCDEEEALEREREECKARATEQFEREFEKRDECERNIFDLVRYGANTRIRDFRGNTLLETARVLGLHEGIIRLLENAR